MAGIAYISPNGNVLALVEGPRGVSTTVLSPVGKTGLLQFLLTHSEMSQNLREKVLEFVSAEEEAARRKVEAGKETGKVTANTRKSLPKGK